MRRLLLRFPALLCMCLLALPLSSAEESSVKVGVSLALTGGLAEYGVAARNGLLLAQKRHPELFKKLEFIYEDDSYQSKNAVSNFRKFTTIHKVDLVFSWGAEPSLALAPLAERSQTVFVTQSPLIDVSKGRKYVLRFIYNDDKHGRVITEYLRQHGANKIGLVMSELSFFELLTNGIEKHLKAGQSLEVFARVLPGETDFRSILLRSDLVKYDIIGVYLLPAQIRLFYKQARELDIPLKTFGTTTFESTTVLRDVMPLIEDVPYTHSSTSSEFIESYREAFGNDMHVGYAAGCYDFAVLLGRLVSAGVVGPGSEADEILRALRSVEPFEGASGRVRFVDSPAAGQYFDSGLSVKKFVSGKIVTEYSAQ